MSEHSVPLWLDFVILGFLAGMNFLSAAYGSALLGASRSRIKRALEQGSPTAPAFLARAAGDDPTILMRVDFLYVFSTIGFTCWGLWEAYQLGGTLSLASYFRGAALFLLILFLIRMAASLTGDHFRERLVLGAALPMAALSTPFLPLVWLALAALRVFARAAGVADADLEEDREAEVIDAISDGQLDGVVENGQKEMIEGIIDFKDADVADIIVPRTEMTSVDVDATLSEAVAIGMARGLSRLPAYRDNRDNIVGIFYLRDALRYWDKPESERPPLADLVRPPLFVPETKLIPELLAEMRRGEAHLAVVLDEYGGTAGLVTMEDVLEEIVGDIQDEYDAKTRNADGKLRRLDDNSLLADGGAHVAEINKMLGEVIIPEDDDYETAAGFVLDNLGHIPKAGESFVYEDKLLARVLQADDRRVRRVRFQFNPENGGREAT
ncbi:MAG: hemolysin family protein [Planctomycetota bacterium]|jgi:CBS domain containing-hemolysin-like protein|nr:hemolysin family protein [Planctomycetota bacterium]